MNNVAVPSHQTHLQPEDYWIVAFIGQDEPDPKAVSDPRKPSSPHHVATLVDGPVARESFTQMGVKAFSLPLVQRLPNATQQSTSFDPLVMNSQGHPAMSQRLAAMESTSSLGWHAV